MDVTPLLRSDQKIIQAYAQGRFKISGTHYEGPIMVTTLSVTPWANADINNLTPAAFDHLKGEVDVLLIGAGSRSVLLMPDKRAAFRDAGFTSVEVMDTGAACRTFNVLTAEGRRVAAALFPV